MRKHIDVSLFRCGEPTEKKPGRVGVWLTCLFSEVIAAIDEKYAAAQIVPLLLGSMPEEFEGCSEGFH
ncbi:hypothetical protein Pan258_46240 [Symmachiella dynata]|nr:hypothetical protein Pan258_46240 [Symmachiella dynata]